MIIVEGPDGAGKSTLIKNIQAQYPDLEVAGRVVSKDTEMMTDLQAWVNQNLAEGFQYRLFDRHRLISEFIYGPVLRPSPQPGFASPTWVFNSLRRFARIQPLVIYCLPPLEVIKANLENDQDNIRVRDHIESIYAGYLHRAALESIDNRMTTIVYDYTIDGQYDDPLYRLHLAINQAHEKANQ